MRFWGCLSGDAGEGWKIDWNVLVQITLKLHTGRQGKIERDAVDVCASSSSSNGESLTNIKSTTRITYTEPMRRSRGGWLDLWMAHSKHVHYG